MSEIREIVYHCANCDLLMERIRRMDEAFKLVSMIAYNVDISHWEKSKETLRAAAEQLAHDREVAEIAKGEH